MTHKPRKRFGQHFLHDRSTINRIIDVIVPYEDIPIVEIGPGTGALTVPLLEQAASLDVIEIDRDLAGLLREKCGNPQGLRIHTEDVLKFDFRRLHRKKIKVVGNLPYNISTPLLFHLLGQIECIHEMVFMLQKEIVDRICAEPRDPNYGRLTVMIRSRCHSEKIMTVGPGAFSPEPKVKSSLVRLIPRTDLQGLIRDADLFSDIVRNAFSQRRKTIRNALKDYLDAGDFKHLGLDPSARAGALEVTDFIGLSNYLLDRRSRRNSVDKPVDDNSR